MTNMPSENQWLEDVFPIEIVPFLREHVSFPGVYLIYAGLWPVQMASAGGISLPLCFGGCQRELPWHEPTFRRHQECAAFQFWLSHCKYDQITCCMMSLCMIVIASSRVSRSVAYSNFDRNKFGQLFSWWLRNKRGWLFSGAFCCTVACFNLKIVQLCCFWQSLVLQYTSKILHRIGFGGV